MRARIGNLMAIAGRSARLASQPGREMTAMLRLNDVSVALALGNSSAGSLAVRRNFSVASTSGAPELTESEFHAKADATLEAIECVASALDETIRDGFDVSLSTGVLTLKLGGKGTYVLNKQTPNRQLWWSSPMSGPKRYAWDGAARDWRNTRDGHAMTAKLAEELRALTGAELDFSSAAEAAADAHGAA